MKNTKDDLVNDLLDLTFLLHDNLNDFFLQNSLVDDCLDLTIIWYTII